MGRELGKPEGGLGSGRPVTSEGEGGMDHPSLPSKCFAGSVLGSELGVWHPDLRCLAPLISAPNKVHQIKSQINMPHVQPHVDHQGI